MKSRGKYKGFSLVEVLMAIGILSIGMLLIAAVFPVAIHFTTIATERTIASSVADEAFAKIKLCAIDFNSPPWPVKGTPEEFYCFDFNDVKLEQINPSEFLYPSDTGIYDSKKMYCWSAICRKLEFDPTGRNIQVTVFVSRRVMAGTRYYDTDLSGNLVDDGLWPIPLPVEITNSGNPREINISETSPASPKRNFINPGCTIVDGRDGRIYRVRDRRMVGSTSVIVLESDWPLSQTTGTVWVVAPPVGGGRYPCIAVYQKVIRF